MSGAPSGPSWRTEMKVGGSRRCGVSSGPVLGGSADVSAPAMQSRRARPSAPRRSTRPSETASPGSSATARSRSPVSWSPAGTTSGEPAAGLPRSASIRAYRSGTTPADDTQLHVEAVAGLPSGGTDVREGREPDDAGAALAVGSRPGSRARAFDDRPERAAEEAAGDADALAALAGDAVGDAVSEVDGPVRRAAQLGGGRRARPEEDRGERGGRDGETGHPAALLGFSARPAGEPPAMPRAIRRALAMIVFVGLKPGNVGNVDASAT